MTLLIGANVATAGGGWAAAAVAAALATVAAFGAWRVRQTTLTAAATWAAAAAAAIAAVEGGLAARGVPDGSLAASLWRYVAAVGALTPVVAVLGAKRPQDRGWQWVVGALWLILLAPAGQALAASSGSRLELVAAWRLLAWCLVGMGLLNYLPTRSAAAAVMAAVGQALLLAPYLGWPASEQGGAWRLAALATLLAAAAYGAIMAPRFRNPEHPLAAGDRLQRANARWAALRDGWGAFWALRIQQRVNQTAELSGWPVRLDWWKGFVPLKGAGSGEASSEPLRDATLAHIEQTLDSLLRRFERIE
jgi:hypothetical protein